MTPHLARRALVALIAALPIAGIAQDTWPTRAITMIIPFPPGGVADTVGRPVADALSRILGQPVVWRTAPARAVGLAWPRSRAQSPTDTR